MITIQAGYALVIDDEPANRDFLERLLQTASFKVTGAATGGDGLKAARSMPALALALVDQQLPDATGLEIIAKLRAANPEAFLVMATMHDDRNLIDQAFEIGIDVFLVKPHGFMELYRRLQEVDSDTTLLRQLVIDQYGPRPYRGRKPGTQPAELIKPTTGKLIPSVGASRLQAANPEASNESQKPPTKPPQAKSFTHNPPVSPTDPTAPSRSSQNNSDIHNDVTLLHRPRMKD